MHFTNLKEYSDSQITDLISLASDIKSNSDKYSKRLEDKVLSLLFFKPSLRTRSAFQIGMYQLGGQCQDLNPKLIHLSRGESLKDTVKVLSAYTDCIVVRVYDYSQIEEVRRYSSVPVINALTNQNHPSQAIADLMTIREILGKLKDVNLLFVGSPNNNILQSLLASAPRFEVNIKISCPKILTSQSSIPIYNDLLEVVSWADIIYTDAWFTMQDKETAKNKTIELFKDYQINETILEKAKPEVKIMHCLPAHRGLEITDDVLDSNKSIAFEQAYNRLHSAKAILLACLT